MISDALPPSTLDLILTAQLAIAWAGEKGEDPRLGWWRTDLVSEYGGVDLFERLLPNTFQWAVLQAAREAARRHDAALRAPAHDPDALRTLFHWGFAVDERLDERLADLKAAGAPPTQALPALAPVITDDWDPDTFTAWVASHPRADSVPAPRGRRLRGAPPKSLDTAAGHLVAALVPLGAAYPLPHYVVAR